MMARFGGLRSSTRWDTTTSLKSAILWYIMWVLQSKISRVDRRCLYDLLLGEELDILPNITTVKFQVLKVSTRRVVVVNDRV